MRENLIEKMKQMQRNFLQSIPDMGEEDQPSISPVPGIDER